jgi:hypothetical protein
MLSVEELLWFPSEAMSDAETRIAKRAAKKRKLFVFLREQRTKLFDEGFQRELIEMYRQTGAGKPPHPPALLAMATLLQAYCKAADHEAVELTADSKRWQMVLGCLGAEEPTFSQGALYDFRMRLMSTQMDKRLLERTVELARATGDFNDRSLRLALDSSPLWGRGRVEDTVNLLGHASRKVLECVADLTRHTVAEVISEIGLRLFDAPSIKAALDVDWSDPQAKNDALDGLIDEIESLQKWITMHLASEMQRPPLQNVLETLNMLMEQDLEPDPSGGTRIRQGVAKGRRISVEDREMRHGRKSKTKCFDGYKRHIARDIDEQLILAVAARPGNERDAEAVSTLLTEATQGRELLSLHIDRAYLHADEIAQLEADGVAIVSRPPPMTNVKTGGFSKRDFIIDTEAMEVTCPAGCSIPIELGRRMFFPAETCFNCHLRDGCTTAKDRGRCVEIHPREKLHQQLLALSRERLGRVALRERVDAEHALAHISQRQGNEARYMGVRKNTFHLTMASAIQNLERAQTLQIERLAA